MRMTSRDWLLLLLLSVLWGGSFFFAAIAVKELPPFTVVILRSGLAALTLALVLKMQHVAWPLATGTLTSFAVLSLLNNVIPYSLLFWAQTQIPSGLASILNAMTPIFSILVAHLALSDERMSVNKAIGIGFGFAGVVVLLGADVLTGTNIATLGMIACLGAALSFGLAGVYGRRFAAMRLSVTQIAFGQLVATTIIMLPIVTIFDAPWTLPVPSMRATLSVLALAVASTALAYIVFFKLLSSAGAVNTALVTLLVPVSAILLGSLILGEALLLRHYAGMALIAAGLIAINGRGFSRAEIS